MRFLFFVARKGLFKNFPLHHGLDSDTVLLWRSVLDQVLHDAGSKNERIRKEATDWVSLDNPDFHLVCDLALLNHRTVHDTFKRILFKMAQDNKELDTQDE